MSDDGSNTMGNLPLLGAKVRFTATASKRGHNWTPGSRTEWARVPETFGQAREGFFVGARTVYEGVYGQGKRYRDSWDYEGGALVERKAVTVWLIAIHPRRKFIRVFPDDCTVVSDIVKVDRAFESDTE